MRNNHFDPNQISFLYFIRNFYSNECHEIGKIITSDMFAWRARPIPFMAKVLSHVTIMPVLLRPLNNFLGQVIGNASEGKYNTVNISSSGEVTFKKCLNSGMIRSPYFHLKIATSHKHSPTGHTRGYMKLGSGKI